MTYFIIIRGPLGVGKSTIAQELAKTLKGEHISIDQILKKNNLDIIDKKEGCISAKNFIKANELILDEIKKKLKQGQIIIFDGCFYHQEQIDHLINNLNYPHYIFTLKAPLKVCIERDSAREGSYGKGAAIAVHNLVSRFEAGIIIETNSKNIEQTVKEILNKLPSNI